MKPAREIKRTKVFRESFRADSQEALTQKILGRLRQLIPNTSNIRRVKVQRNDLCPCGSQKRFKHCCVDKIENYYQIETFNKENK